jgi:type IV pilus assembly protein PilC
LQTGFVEAGTREAAFTTLSGHDLFVLSIEEPREATWLTSLLDYFKRVRQIDVAVFTRQFATLLEAGIPLSDALKSLYRQTRNPILREVVFEISGDIDAGLSLSQAMARHETVFSEFYINLLRSAEVTGRVESVMGFLADYLEKEHILRTKVRSALIYPAFVVVLFFIVGGILVGVVFPQISPIFEEAGVELPFTTRVLLSLGGFVREWWLAIIIITLIFLGLVVDYARSREGRLVFDELAIKLPVLGNLFKKMYVARFAESASVLIKGGIPVTQAIEISSHTVGSAVYREALHEASEGIRRGELLSALIEKGGELFPPMVSQMIAVGESTGKLDDMLDRMAGFFTREVDDAVSNLVELIQPALMVVIGVLTGLLFASILLPIYNLVQAF